MLDQTPFVSGLDLAEAFYQEVGAPILQANFPDLLYSAGLIGWGSEVLGFDTPLSRDHHWGPRFMLFLSEEDDAQLRQKISQIFSQELPHRFRGYPTSFSTPDSVGVRLMVPTEAGPVHHMIHIEPLRSLLRWYLGHDLTTPLTPSDWLTFSEQKLLALTSGKVFHDGLGVLDPMRNALAYYPRDIWLYQMASLWQQISEEEPFVGRAGSVGDELGSRLIASRQVHLLMRLCFLMERQYAPYSKWFGSAFSRLKSAPILNPLYNRVFTAETWQEREIPLCAAYETVAHLHNELKITPPVKEKVSFFHERPYKVIHADEIANAIREQIRDETVRAIPALIGSVNDFSACTPFLESPELTRRAKILYVDNIRSGG
ncbi:MAG TPA: DUF4037 domain-containing protein [Anaerolineaceae bacterium]